MQLCDNCFLMYKNYKLTVYQNIYIKCIVFTVYQLINSISHLVASIKDDG